MARPGSSTKNTEKRPPRAEILEPQENTPKILENTKNTHFLYFRDIFSVLSGYFGGIFLGFQNFGPGGLFSAFFVEIPGRVISGLCSRSGRSQIWEALSNMSSCVFCGSRGFRGSLVSNFKGYLWKLPEN